MDLDDSKAMLKMFTDPRVRTHSKNQERIVEIGSGLGFRCSNWSFRLQLPVKSQLLDLIELAVVKDAEFKTGMRALIAYAHQKGFWTLLNVLFTQSAEKLTPRLLKEKLTEVVVFHLMYKLLELHSPEVADSLLGADTAKKLSQLTNPEQLDEIVKGIKWPEWDLEELSWTKPSG